jgi:hypothetical protein
VETNYEIYFESVDFEFYIKKTQITKDTCKYENFITKSLNYFRTMTKIFFIYEVSYTSPICPYVFINTQVEFLGLYEITNSFIFKNHLEFINVDDDTQLSNVNSTIKNFKFGIFLEDLTTKILCPHIFKNVQYLSITGSLYQMQLNLFESLTKIEYLLFSLDDLKGFFQRGLQWMSYLNKDLNLRKVNSEKFRQNSNRVLMMDFNELNARYLTKAYTYPDEDICLFEHFPHQKLVIPSFYFLTEFKCTCTLIWLIQNYKFYNFQYVSNDMKMLNDYQFFIKNRNVTECLKNANYSLIFDSCQFEQKFNNCLHSGNTKVSFKMSALDIFYIFEWLKLVIEVYTREFFSILGLITNTLIILVLRNKNFKTKFDNLMYKHIYYNSLFNFIFCFINSFSLINICIFPKSSFCSRFYKTQLAQYFKIIFTLYLCNSIRLCCNFSFILFSLSRFYIITSKNWKIFFLLKKLKQKIFYVIIFISCSLWSMFKLFEYKPNEVYSSFDKNFPYNRYDQKYCQKVDSLYKFLETGCRIFPILNLINNILNNIIILIISVTIDVCMIRFANKNYQHSIQLFHDQKHLDEALEHKKKILKLIIINGLLFFFSHIPEFVSTVLLIIYNKELIDFCYFSMITCTDINEIFETFSILSISLQFFVYKHFDNNFYESYKDLKQKLKTFIKFF